MSKVFSQYFPSHALQQIVFDAAVLFVAVVLTASFQLRGASIDWRAIVPSAMLFAGAMIILNSALGLYRPGTREGSAAPRIIVSVLVSIPVAFAIFALLPWNYFESEAIQISIVLLLGLVLLMRGLANGRGSASTFTPRVLILGTGSEAAAVARALGGPLGAGTEFIGFYPCSEDESVVVDEKEVISSDESFLETVRRCQANEVIVAVRERRGGVLPIRELLDCKLRGVKVLDLSSFFERSQGQVPIDYLKASWLIYGDGFRQSLLRNAVKRVFDLVIASALVVFTLPLMILTALAIILEDGAPVFYRQERVGRGGRILKVIKFRSMRRDAEKDGKPRWAANGDNRVTRVGRVIRKLRIDELPQLFNVLSGEMSLVGPRPERPYFVDQLAKEIPFYAVRHSVKPGVTGWAQVRYHYGASVDDAIQKLQYDLYYVKNHNLMLDTLVLFETVRVVLTGEGAQ